MWRMSGSGTTEVCMKYGTVSLHTATRPRDSDLIETYRRSLDIEVASETDLRGQPVQLLCVRDEITCSIRYSPRQGVTSISLRSPASEHQAWFRYVFHLESNQVASRLIAPTTSKDCASIRKPDRTDLDLLSTVMQQVKEWCRLVQALKYPFKPN